MKAKFETRIVRALLKLTSKDPARIVLNFINVSVMPDRSLLFSATDGVVAGFYHANAEEASLEECVFEQRSVLVDPRCLVNFPKDEGSKLTMTAEGNCVEFKCGQDDVFKVVHAKCGATWPDVMFAEVRRKTEDFSGKLLNGISFNHKKFDLVTRVAAELAKSSVVQVGFHPDYVTSVLCGRFFGLVMMTTTLGLDVPAWAKA